MFPPPPWTPALAGVIAAGAPAMGFADSAADGAAAEEGAEVLAAAGAAVVSEEGVAVSEAGGAVDWAEGGAVVDWASDDGAALSAAVMGVVSTRYLVSKWTVGAFRKVGTYWMRQRRSLRRKRIQRRWQLG